MSTLKIKSRLTRKNVTGQFGHELAWNCTERFLGEMIKYVQIEFPNFSPTIVEGFFVGGVSEDSPVADGKRPLPLYRHTWLCEKETTYDPFRWMFTARTYSLWYGIDRDSYDVTGEKITELLDVPFNPLEIRPSPGERTYALLRLTSQASRLVVSLFGTTYVTKKQAVVLGQMNPFLFTSETIVSIYNSLEAAGLHTVPSKYRRVAENKEMDKELKSDED